MRGAFDRYRLPSGRHGLPESHVRESHHWRLLGACAEVIASRGYGGLSLRALTREAAVSKATFYKHFDSLGDCVEATYSMAAENVLFLVAGACEERSGAEATLAVGLNSIIDLLASEPALAHVLTDQALLDLPGVRSQRARTDRQIAALIAASAAEGSTAKREADRRLSLHRVRAAVACLSPRLVLRGTPALAEVGPELARLLEG